MWNNINCNCSALYQSSSQNIVISVTARQPVFYFVPYTVLSQSYCWLHHLGEDRKCSTVDSFWAIFSICCGNHMLSYVVVFIMYLHHFQMVPMIQDSCTILAQTMKEVADSGKSADVWRYAHYIHHVQEEKGVVMCTCMNMYWQFCASHSKLFLQYAISEFMVVSSIYMYM